MSEYESKRIAQIYRRIDAGNNAYLMEQVIGVLRVSAWFEFLRANLPGGAPLTPYAVGRLLQPETYVKEGAHHQNLWAKYAQGQHVPSALTLSKIEVHVPGSAAVLNSRLWWMLDCKRPRHMDVAMLDSLSYPIRDCMFVLEHGRVVIARSWDDSLDRLCERASGLEALVAAVWVLREALHAGDEDNYLSIGEYLHSILLMVLASKELHCIRYTLMAFFFEFVFPLCSGRDLTLNPDPQQLLESAEAFDEVRWLYEDSGTVEPVHHGDSSSCYALFEGSLGWDMRLGLGPHYGVREGATNPEAHLHARRCRIYRTCALAVLGQGPAVSVPPRAVRLRVCGGEASAAFRSRRLRDVAVS